MKKLLSVLCMALIAGGLLFTSCGKQFTITVNSNNSAFGTVTGGGEYAENATAVLTATPNAGYVFVKWNDGNTDNPRTITVTATETYTAIFEALPIEPSVKVSFDGTNWTAGSITGQFYATYDAWRVYEMETSGSYPMADACMYTGTNTGSYSAAAGENGALDNEDFGWVEYYKETYLTDANQNQYGDWWAKSATVNVSEFDATALTITSNVNATMFDALEALTGDEPAGVDAAATAPMTVSIQNVTLTSAKGTLKNKGAKNLVAVR